MVKMILSVDNKLDYAPNIIKRSELKFKLNNNDIILYIGDFNKNCKFEENEIKVKKHLIPQKELNEIYLIFMYIIDSSTAFIYAPNLDSLNIKLAIDLKLIDANSDEKLLTINEYLIKKIIE